MRLPGKENWSGAYKDEERLKVCRMAGAEEGIPRENTEWKDRERGQLRNPKRLQTRVLNRARLFKPLSRARSPERTQPPNESCAIPTHTNPWGIKLAADKAGGERTRSRRQGPHSHLKTSRVRKVQSWDGAGECWSSSDF